MIKDFAPVSSPVNELDPGLIGGAGPLPDSSVDLAGGITNNIPDVTL